MKVDPDGLTEQGGNVARSENDRFVDADTELVHEREADELHVFDGESLAEIAVSVARNLHGESRRGHEEPVIVPQGVEVISRRVGEEEEVIFTTDRRLTVVPPKLAQLRREEDFHKNYLPRLGIETFYAFDRTEPQVGDTFYLGFEESQDISGHILQLTFECERTQAVGVRREDPPWVWECSMGDGTWEEINPPHGRIGSH